MIVSHQHRFVFIKTRKTAGTSIEVFLSGYCGDDAVVTPIFPKVDTHLARNHDGYFNHMTAGDARERLGDNVWSSYFTFCVERNPWDKTISDYHMQRARVDRTLSLDNYLASGKLPRNVGQYYSESEGLIVDRVVRFERLNTELGEIFGMLGVSFGGALGVHAKGEYRVDRRYYREIFTEHQARIVGDIFSDEVALHEYSF